MLAFSTSVILFLSFSMCPSTHYDSHYSYACFYFYFLSQTHSFYYDPDTEPLSHAHINQNPLLPENHMA